MHKRPPITSPIARPGRRYVSGLVYLGLALLVALGVLGLRALVG